MRETMLYRRLAALLLATALPCAGLAQQDTLKEIERYTARADQARLAQSAVAKLPDEENKP